MLLGAGRALRSAAFLSFIGALSLGSLSVANAQSQINEQELYLEAHINGAETGLIGRFISLSDGGLKADAQELRNIGVETAGLVPDKNGDISVDRLPGVTFRIDHADQSIHFQVQAEARAAKVIDVAAPEYYLPAAPPSKSGSEEDPVSRGFGAVLNYSIYTETDAWGYDRNSRAYYSSAFNSRMFTPHGALNHNFSYSATMGHQRYETYWRTPIARHAVQLQAGDLITRGPTWARPVRLGGLQIERNFGLRPDVITTPLPSYSGTAAVPTTVDVYDGSIRRYSTDVPAGPFELTNLPFATGANQATVILRDATGREIAQDMIFLVSPDLLRKGTADYSVSLGYPRIGIGTRNDDYQEDLYGAASLRFGASDNVTLSAHAEGGDGLGMAGVGGTFRVGTLGTVSASYAQSYSSLGTGELYDLLIQATKGRLSFSGRLLRAEDTFTDIARHTTMAATYDDGFLLDYSTITSLNQFAVGYSAEGYWDGIQAVYADNKRLDGTEARSFGLSSSFRIGQASSLNLSALATRGDRSEMLLGASVYVPLGERRSASLRAQTRDGQARYAAGLAQSRDYAKSDWEWRIEAIRDARSSIDAFAGRRFRGGQVDVAARVGDDNTSIGLRAEGAVVLAGGGFFLSNRIDDSFAVVDAGAPGVEVEVENRPIGKTGRSGKILVPDLRSYEPSSISIKTDALPIEAEVPSTREVVTPAYNTGVTLDFNVNTAPSNAIVYLVSSSGEPIDVGLNAVLHATDETFVVGYDGMVYLSGLSAQNSLSVSRADGWSCTAQFTYQAQADTITDLGEVPCQ